MCRNYILRFVSQKLSQALTVDIVELLSFWTSNRKQRPKNTLKYTRITKIHNVLLTPYLLQQFLFPVTSCLASKKKIARHAN